MKIAEITKDSDMGSFLKMNEVEEALQFVDGNAISNFKETTYDALKREISSGGLDQYSLNINGNIYGYEKANSICSQLDSVFTEISSLKSKIIEAAKSHIDAEYEKYIAEVQKEIDRLDKEILAVQKRIDNDVNAVNSFFAGYFADKWNLERERERWLNKKTEAQSAWSSNN